MTLRRHFLFGLLLLICCLQFEVQGFPFIYLHSKKPVVSWTQPLDNWNYENVPRSTKPHLEVKNFPNRTSTLTLTAADFLQQFEQQQRSQNLSSKSRIFEPKLFGKFINWNELAYDIENVVIPCTACNAGAGLILHFIKTGKPDAEIIKLIAEFCTNLKIQKARVCQGIAQLFGSEVIYVLKRITTEPKEFCSFLLGDVCGDAYDRYHEWEVIFPPIAKPTPKASNLPIPNMGAPYFKVLHISDYHYDPHYEEGSNAECGEPLCCRSSSGKPARSEAAAGKWGDFRNCDTPKRTVDSMLNHIVKTHNDIDYILWTGDLPPHDIWNQSKSLNLEIIKETVKQMTEYFPGVPIFPALGNHESSPVNSFPPPYINQANMSIDWLYDELDAQWKRWLPETTSETVRRGAFYSVLLRPRFRIISLNMNYCNNKNWWLLLNSTDPATELQWFIYELQSAELSNEKVHVIGHIPPGNVDCLKVWSRNFYKIIARFEHTIVAQFYGHTHYDEFEVFYDPGNWNHPTSIAYIGPSVSPYENLNPGYRVYYIDGDHDATTRLVIDHETWIMDLREANLQDVDDPIWYKLYTARSSYGMQALRPSDWNELIGRLINNKDVFEKYYKYYWKDSPMRPPCKEMCRKRLICDCKSGRSHDRKQFCKELEPKSLVVRGIEKGPVQKYLTIRSVEFISIIKHLLLRNHPIKVIGSEILQQFLRANYIFSIWNNAHLKNPTTYQPDNNGWVLKNNKYHFKRFEGDQLPSYVRDSPKTQSGTKSYVVISPRKIISLFRSKVNGFEIIIDSPNMFQNLKSNL